jgi:galactokinase/mevalonate kinase-like predicted kinase
MRERTLEILATAPGRCGIVGNPSDIYGGCVLSCTVQERASCRLVTEGAGIRITNEDEEALLTHVGDLTLQKDKIDVARAVLRWFEIDPAQATFSLHLSTAIPMRSGMAGSTAMLATLVGAISTYLGQNLSPYHLAETTRKVENRVMGIVCGLQDQHMVTFGGLNFMDFVGKQDLEQTDEEPLATVEPLGNFSPNPPLLLAHTGVEHNSSAVHRSPRQRWLEGDPLVHRSYKRVAELARRGKRAFIEQDWQTLGAVMNENHALVSELGGSGEENDRLIEAARQAGAWGAKLAGAGGGGTIIALTTEPEQLAKELITAGAERILYPKPVAGLTISRG